ncbi:MAG: hypothetical protein C4287_22960 [Leptolyngbya sp. ERB_1_2]
MPKGVARQQVLTVDAATETVLAEGSAAFAALCQRGARRFRRQEVRQRFGRSLAALRAPLPRRNGWQLAEQTGEARP